MTRLLVGALYETAFWSRVPPCSRCNISRVLTESWFPATSLSAKMSLDLSITSPPCPVAIIGGRAVRKVDVELDRESDAILDGRYGVLEVSCD